MTVIAEIARVAGSAAATSPTGGCTLLRLCLLGLCLLRSGLLGSCLLGSCLLRGGLLLCLLGLLLSIGLLRLLTIRLLGLTIGLLRLLTVRLLGLTIRLLGLSIRLLTVRLLGLTIGLLTIRLLRLTIRLLSIGLLTVRLLSIRRLSVGLLTILLLLLLHLHLLHIGLGGSSHKALGCTHAHTDTHKAGHRTVGIGACCLNTSGDRGLYEGLTHTGVVVDSDTVSLLKELLGILIIGNAGDTDILDLQTTILTPYRVKRITHILGELCCLGRDTGQRLTEH